MADKQIKNLVKNAVTQKQLNDLKQKANNTQEITNKLLEDSTTNMNKLVSVMTDLNQKFTEVYKKQLESKKLEEDKKKIAEETLAVKLKEAGLSANQIKSVTTTKNALSDSANKYKDMLNSSMMLNKLSKIPMFGSAITMGKELTSGILSGIDKFGQLAKIGKNTFDVMRMAQGSFFTKLKLGIMSTGITLQGVLTSTGVLAVFMAITAAVYALQTAFKFNIGNIAGIFGAGMAQLKSMWAIFELKVVGGLKKFAPFFSAAFTGIMDVAIMLSEVFFDLFETFGKGFNMGTNVDTLTRGASGLFGIIKSVISILTPSLKIWIFYLGAIFGVLASIFSMIFDIVDAILGPLADAANWMTDKLSSITDWFSGGSIETPEITEAGSGGSNVNSNQQNNININVAGNMDKETADIVMHKQQSSLPNMKKLAQVNPV